MQFLDIYAENQNDFYKFHIIDFKILYIITNLVVTK